MDWFLVNRDRIKHSGEYETMSFTKGLEDIEYNHNSEFIINKGFLPHFASLH